VIRVQATTLYLFQCAHTAIYAFSTDKTGCNIPRSLAHAAWFLRADLEPADIEHDMGPLIEEIAARGFCLVKTKRRTQRGRR
jgi:hypothetical protein